MASSSEFKKQKKHIEAVGAKNRAESERDALKVKGEAALKKHGEDSPQAKEALKNYTKAQTSYDKAHDAAAAAPASKHKDVAKAMATHQEALGAARTQEQHHKALDNAAKDMDTKAKASAGVSGAMSRIKAWLGERKTKKEGEKATAQESERSHKENYAKAHGARTKELEGMIASSEEFHKAHGEDIKRIEKSGIHLQSSEQMKAHAAQKILHAQHPQRVREMKQELAEHHKNFDKDVKKIEEHHLLKGKKGGMYYLSKLGQKIYAGKK